MNDEKRKAVCKIGQGNECCRYLVVGAKGFECMKLTSLKTTLDNKAEQKTMNAQGDNCSGEPEQQEFEIWTEGYAAQGGGCGASLRGKAFGSNFKEACDKLAEQNPAFGEYYSPDRLAYWGCRLFETQAEAIKSYG